MIALTLLTPICHVAFSEYTPLKKSSKSLYTVFPSCLFALLPCCQLTLPRLSETEILAMLGNIISAKHDGGINRITNLHNYSCTNDTNTQENNILYIYIYLKDNLQHNRIKSAILVYLKTGSHSSSRNPTHWFVTFWCPVHGSPRVCEFIKNQSS